MVTERDHLIIANMPLARSRVARILGRADEDAVSEAYIGLVRAADRFNPDKGCEFSTFAVSYIDGHIRRHRSYNTTIRPKEDKDGVLHYRDVCSIEALHPDVLGRCESAEEEVVGRLAFDEFLDSLTTRQRTVALCLMKGYKKFEIGKILGRSHTIVSQETRALRMAALERLEA